jgi:hypothetical protein
MLNIFPIGSNRQQQEVNRLVAQGETHNGGCFYSQNTFQRKKAGSVTLFGTGLRGVYPEQKATFFDSLRITRVERLAMTFG